LFFVDIVIYIVYSSSRPAFGGRLDLFVSGLIVRFGSEAVGRLEVLSVKATATFSEPNLKLDEIRQLNPDYPEAPCATFKSAS
ncbi:hypothetical protein ACOTE7_24355, partial [Achromobacter xylosoxidans]